MDKELLKEIEKAALKKVIAKLNKEGFYKFKNPVAGPKAKKLYSLFNIEVAVADPYTIKSIN